MIHWLTLLVFGHHSLVIIARMMIYMLDWTHNFAAYSGSYVEVLVVEIVYSMYTSAVLGAQVSQD